MDRDSQESTFVVQENNLGVRLDKLLALQYPSFSRTYLQKLIEDGYVLVNGNILKKREKLALDDEVEIHFAITPELDIKPQNIPLNILFEDEFFLAINKPSGMVVHPATGNWENTFVNALLFYCKDLESDQHLRPGIVHRLDKETSGVLLAAKTSAMHRALVDLFSKRRMHKKYRAVVLGVPPVEKVISLPLGRHPIHRKEIAVREDGKDAITHLFRTSTNGKISVVELSPTTGRTHQIRVHLKHIGCPILGDPLYGNIQMNEKYKAARTLLHAEELSFVHPALHKEVVIKAPLPDDIAHYMKVCG